MPSLPTDRARKDVSSKRTKKKKKRKQGEGKNDLSRAEGGGCWVPFQSRLPTFSKKTTKDWASERREILKDTCEAIVEGGGIGGEDFLHKFLAFEEHMERGGSEESGFRS